MHQTLEAIRDQLGKIVAQIQTSVPSDEPFGNAHGHWGMPGLTRTELIDEAQSIIDLIEDQGVAEVGDHQPRLQDYNRRLQHLHQNTIGQLWGSNALHAIPAYLFTLNGLRKALEPTLNNNGHLEAATKLRKLTAQLRGLEARLNGLEPRTASLSTMVERIEHAYNAADQLPADLESLAEARLKIDSILQQATRDQSHVFDVRQQADDLDERLRNSAEDATAVLARCETAYSAATSVGLAAAFSERSSELSRSMWFWIGGLIVALLAGGVFGSGQLRALADLFKIPDVSGWIIALNLLLSMLSVGAPVWFAWLATKQIGQRFRLAEDYAFKASVSRAYEGFRREAARFDKQMEGKLLASALARFDELPLRLVETTTHGSPWHELASSDAVKQAMKIVPGFAEQVATLASSTIDAVKPSKTKPKAVSTAVEE
jgi:hypothetical protein